MTNKIKIQLRRGEIIALAKHVHDKLTSVTTEQAIGNPVDMLILSALFDLYEKLKPKCENIRIFKSKRTDETYNVTITRTQALALYCADWEALPAQTALASYEQEFINRLMGNIHKTFLV